MNAFHKRSLRSLLTPVAASALASAAAAAPLTGVYDENVTQLNTVNGSAAFVSATGAASAANVVAVAGFETAVETAFLAGNGGVLTFDAQINVDDQVPTTGITSPVSATFDGGSKTVEIAYALGDSGTLFRQGNLSNRTPISANNGSTPGFAATTQDETPGSLTLSFGTVVGGDTDEAVGQVGFTFLSRTSRDYGVVTAVATFSDGSTTTAAFDNTVFTAGDQDTFFGFESPAGTSIASITVSTENEFQFSVDDVGLVTTIVPEPGSLSLFAFGVALLVARPRHR